MDKKWLLMDKKRTCFPEVKTTPGEDAVKSVGMFICYFLIYMEPHAVSFNMQG